MRLTSLSLTDYRNIGTAQLLPHEGVNVIYGNNAQGKTNLIEAIFLLTGQKTFRLAKESDLIRFGCNNAKIEAKFWCGGREQEIVLQLGGKKTAELNEVPVQPSELTGRFYAVVFSPTELALIKDGPAQRRAFLDSAISQVMPRYVKTLNSMNKALYQRNSLLSDIRKVSGLEDTLDAWDNSFAKLTYSIINARKRYINRLAPHAEKVYEGISSQSEKMSISYSCSIDGLQEELSSTQGEQAVLSALRSCRAEDIKNGYTTIGAHRDDLEVTLNGISARSYGSQGQQRSCALTLKLAECHVIEEVCGEMPILLLDDVFSELDKSRRDYFLRGLKDCQVFITCCDKSGIRGLVAGKTFRMQNGVLKNGVSRRNVSTLGTRNTGKK